MIRRLMAVLLACLVVAGCADTGGSGSDDNKNDNRFGGFYGGMNGGGGVIH
jgi:hypothetical protein